MAISTICEHCGAGLSAPDSSLGTKVPCPTCGRKTRVLTPAESKALVEKQARENERQEERRSRLELLARLEREEAMRGGIESSVRNFQPRAGTRHGRLRQMGGLLLGLSWVVFILMGIQVIAELMTVLGFSEAMAGSAGFGDVAREIAFALLAFALMRIAAEACFFMAESGDRQWDIRALLLDLLDEQNRRQDEEVT